MPRCPCMSVSVSVQREVWYDEREEYAARRVPLR